MENKLAPYEEALQELCEKAGVRQPHQLVGQTIIMSSIKGESDGDSFKSYLKITHISLQVQADEVRLKINLSGWNTSKPHHYCHLFYILKEKIWGLVFAEEKPRIKKFEVQQIIPVEILFPEG